MSTKDGVRRAVLERRAARTPEDRAAAAEALAARAVTIPALASAKRVAVYLSLPSEPGTAELIEWLIKHKKKVMVPVITGDMLVWSSLGKDTRIMAGPLGIPQPEGGKIKRLDDADLAFVPALAVDHEGNRLGRGAGYYDRALRDAKVPTCAVVFDDEILESVPTDRHDVPIDMAMAPGGIIRF